MSPVQSWIIVVSVVCIAWKAIVMSDALNRLAASTAAMTTVAESAVAVISGIAQTVRDAVTAAENGDNTQIEGLADSLDAEAGKLGAAITANTPAAPTPTPADGENGGAGQGESTLGTAAGDGVAQQQGDGTESQG